jgi:hypothetical protein
MISFVETMSGSVVDPAGAEHTITFTVAASQERRGHFLLRGLVSSPPWLDEREATGTLVMSAVPPAIVYHLELGEGRTLDAQKTPSPLAPIDSMTFMPVTLRHADGRLIAEGSMRFDMKDLPRFLASWLPWPRPQQKQLDARRRALLRSSIDGAPRVSTP